MRVRIERQVDIAAPADQVWAQVTDWPAQAEWIPLTRVVNLDDTRGVGGRFGAWTGVGRIGFWDPMTITSWERTADGGGRCEVLHLGSLVKGEGEFSVVALGQDRSRFVWAEVVVLPFGRVGGVGWRLVRPLVERVIDRAMQGARRQLEQDSATARRGGAPRKTGRGAS